MTPEFGPDEKIHSVVKVATVLRALATEGIDIRNVLADLQLSEEQISSPHTRVSINQFIECFRFADRHSRDPHFAFHVGLQLHVSAYGMYGFAILSSADYRQTARFATQYQQLSTPVAAIYFSERNGIAVWTFRPASDPRIDERLYKFIVDMQLGSALSLHRDVMGASFVAREIHVTYAAPADADFYPGIFGAPVRFGQSDNGLIFDASWLDGKPMLGNKITYETVVACLSSDNLRLVKCFEKGGSGSSGLEIMRPAADAASGGLRLSYA